MMVVGLPRPPMVAPSFQLHRPHTLTTRMKKIIACLLLLIPFIGFGQAGSEILLFDLSIRKNAVRLTNPRNITQHPGYDNQPFFHPTQPLLFYSSFDAQGRAEIKCYNLESKKTTLVTQTGEREYSPTVMPDLKHLSCIIQRDNGAQDLGKYPLDGGSAVVLIDYLTVGYHAWLDNSNVGLFVLGEPNSFHILRLPDRADTVIATHIGRAIHKVPGEHAVSFVKKAESGWQIFKWNHERRKLIFLAPCLPNQEDLAWTPDGKIIMSDGTGFFVWGGPAEPKWLPVITPADWQGKGITRMAISADGKTMAAVVAE